MESIKKILSSIFARIEVKHKWQQDFLIEIFELVFSIQGRVNYTNLARYSKYNEVTFRRNFKKFFDWLNFNSQIMSLAGVDFDTVIGVIDCSFINKAGKKTYGLDRFYSGVAGRAKRGLEISTLALIDLATHKAWTLDVVQTPAKLAKKEGKQDEYTRIDFYLEQLQNNLSALQSVLYFVADGFYAKTKVFNALCSWNKYLITKLRPDANLRYFFKGKHPEGKQGRKSTYGGKVFWKQLDLRRWQSVGYDYKYNHIKIYTQILNSPYYKRDFKVVLLINTRTNKYILLASTDTNLCARLIVHYYQLRFKIEFLFRDAKQFTGLMHSQARDEKSLHFHFNMSLAAVNLAQLQLANADSDSTIHSMNSLVRRAYNTRLVNWLFLQLPQLRKKAKLNVFNPLHPDSDDKLESVLNFGCLGRA